MSAVEGIIAEQGVILSSLVPRASCGKLLSHSLSDGARESDVIVVLFRPLQVVFVVSHQMSRATRQVCQYCLLSVVLAAPVVGGLQRIDVMVLAT